MDHNKIFAHAVMARTYCREGENLTDPFRRVINAFEKYYVDCIERVGWFAENPKWKEKWLGLMTSGKALPAGRMLWSMGSRTIDEEGFLPMMNCGFVVIDDPIEPFVFIMKMLMLGCGMGFSLEYKYVSKTLKKIEEMASNDPLQFAPKKRPVCQETSKENDPNVYVVEDSREGWLNLLRRVLESAYLDRSFSFSLEKLRPAGTPIKGFGGVSGDPQILANTMTQIHKLIVDTVCYDTELFYDIICLIGQVVVSGNVRRSALIAIGDPHDSTFLSLKTFENMKKAPWRCFCNNSVNVKKFSQLNDQFWATYNGNSEAYGFVNMKKCREAHRTWNYARDSYEPQGFNPCGEQPLANHELCCLGEVNMSRCENIGEFFDALIMCYYFCKFAYRLGCSDPRVQEVSQLNQRIGISLTSLCMSDDGQIIEWTERGRAQLKLFDTAVSIVLGCSESVALTTIKPGGTLTKISGAAGPGIHRPISEYQIRRVRFQKASPILKWLRDCGVPIEPSLMFDGTPDPSGTQIASFYIRNGVPADGHYSDWQVTQEGFAEMLGRVAWLQEIWSDNSISVTVYYPIEHLEGFVKRGIKRVFSRVKTLSLLPYFGHNFPQAPEEPVTEEAFHQFFREHPLVEQEPSMIHIKEHETPEDFGLCESRSQCSDRG